MSSSYNAGDFVRMVLTRFPELRDEFDENPELYHVQIGDFARFTMQAKSAGDWDRYSGCIEIANELWKKPDDYLLNALNVSYLEHLEFDGPNGAKAWDLLPAPLKQGWQNMQDYLDNLARKANSKRV